MDTAAPTESHWVACKPANQCSGEGQQIAYSRLAIHMHLKTIAPKGKTNQFGQVIQAVLNIYVFVAFFRAVLINVENIADNSTAPNLFDKKLGLYCPPTSRRRVVSDLKNLHGLHFSPFAVRSCLGSRDHRNIPTKSSQAADESAWLFSLALSQCRSEEHTSELQSHHDLVCRLLLEKKK